MTVVDRLREAVEVRAALATLVGLLQADTLDLDELDAAVRHADQLLHDPPECDNPTNNIPTIPTPADGDVKASLAEQRADIKADERGETPAAMTDGARTAALANVGQPLPTVPLRQAMADLATAAEDTPDGKACKRCGERKPYEAFGSHATAADGHQGTCRQCVSERMTEVQNRRWARVRAEQRAANPPPSVDSPDSGFRKPDHEPRQAEPDTGEPPPSPVAAAPATSSSEPSTGPAATPSDPAPTARPLREPTGEPVTAIGPTGFARGQHRSGGRKIG